jgi:LysR family transcriptional regulator for bpeEF and oprC
VLSRLGSFVEAHANIQVETDVTNSASAVLERGLDVVLHIGTLTDSNLVVRRLSWVRPIVCASPAYLKAWGIPRHPDDLTKHRAVIYGRADEQSNTTWTFGRGGKSHRVGVPVRLVVRDGIGVTDAVAGGCGIGRPFDIAIDRLLCSGKVRPLLQTGTDLATPFRPSCLRASGRRKWLLWSTSAATFSPGKTGAHPLRCQALPGQPLEWARTR